eukprot:GHVS01031345.1.p1 GENE.GHVS01031345.1~~GHVS01031345.1.p1  ORF type:complete len:939 (-),score=265.79 GHVS01031345.1:212-3028(-)
MQLLCFTPHWWTAPHSLEGVGGVLAADLLCFSGRAHAVAVAEEVRLQRLNPLRPMYTTNRNLLDMIRTASNLHNVKSEELQSQLSRLMRGFVTHSKAVEEVDELSGQLKSTASLEEELATCKRDLDRCAAAVSPLSEAQVAASNDGERRTFQTVCRLLAEPEEKWRRVLTDSSLPDRIQQFTNDTATADTAAADTAAADTATADTAAADTAAADTATADTATADTLQRYMEQQPAVPPLAVALHEWLRAVYELGLRADALEKIEMCRGRLSRASQIKNELEPEQNKWRTAAAEVKLRLAQLTGDVALSAATLSYFGPFPQLSRQRLRRQLEAAAVHCHLTFSADLYMHSFLGDPLQLSLWSLQGLSADNSSMDSGCMVTRGRRCVCLIDPEGFGVSWLKQLEGSSLICCRHAHPHLLDTLQHAATAGTPMLVEEANTTVDSRLESFLVWLDRQQQQLSGALLHEDFRLYIAATTPHLCATPAIVRRLNVVDFSAHVEVLENRLFDKITDERIPDHSDQCREISQLIHREQISLQQLESRVLSLLNEDNSAHHIQTVMEARAVALAAEGRVVDLEEQLLHLRDTRDLYRPLAARGAAVCAAVCDLSRVGVYSCAATLEDVVVSAAVSDESVAVAVESVTWRVFNYVSVGLLDDTHRLCLAANILGKIKHAEKENWEGFWRAAGEAIHHNHQQQQQQPQQQHATSDMSASPTTLLPVGAVPLDAVQKAIAKNMAATRDVPVFRLSYSVRTDALDKLYSDIRHNGVTMSALLAKAVGLALEAQPLVNSRYDSNTCAVVHPGHINVAMAVATEGGLVTPVLKDANTTDIYTLSKMWKGLVTKAKEKTLSRDEYASGTFVISNLGMYGVSSFDAILPDKVGAILAVAAATPTVELQATGLFGVSKRMTATITCDHRHIYGAHAAQFMKDLADIIENRTIDLLK